MFFFPLPQDPSTLRVTLLDLTSPSPPPPATLIPLPAPATTAAASPDGGGVFVATADSALSCVCAPDAAAATTPTTLRLAAAFSRAGAPSVATTLPAGGGCVLAVGGGEGGRRVCAVVRLCPGRRGRCCRHRARPRPRAPAGRPVWRGRRGRGGGRCGGGPPAAEWGGAPPPRRRGHTTPSPPPILAVLHADATLRLWDVASGGRLLLAGRVAREGGGDAPSPAATTLTPTAPPPGAAAGVAVGFDDGSITFHAVAESDGGLAVVAVGAGSLPPRPGGGAAHPLALAPGPVGTVWALATDGRVAAVAPDGRDAVVAAPAVAAGG